MVSLNEFPRSMILSNFLLLFVENNEKRREIGNTCAEILQDCGNGTLSSNLVPKLIEGFEVEKLKTYFTVI